MNLSNSNLTHTEFRDVTANMSIFDGANCHYAKFIDSRLKRSIFDNASLLSTTFDNTELLEASFRSAKTEKIYFAYSNCNGANFSNTGLKDTDLFPANIETALGLIRTSSKEKFLT